MISLPHPTLRFADTRLRRRRSLVKLYAPHRLQLTYNARAAFFLLLRSLAAKERRTILLPAFHCTALVEPVTRTGFNAQFYRIQPDFRPDMDDVRRRMSADVAAIVIIHYFGFPEELDPFLELREEFGCSIVEDCAHSFLTESEGLPLGHRGDFSLFSYYKFAPTLTGGGLGINGPHILDFPGAAKVSMREHAVLAKRLFEQILENSPRNLLARLLLGLERRRVAQRQAQSEVVSHAAFVDDPYLFREDLARAAMPGICRHVLESCDWESIVAARRNNYALLSEAIQDRPVFRRVFPTLPAGVCPWAFPVILENRLFHEQQLRARGIPLFTFGEVLHPLLSRQNDLARTEAEYLSQRLLLLPVHIQIDAAKVKEIANRLVAYLDEVAGQAGDRAAGEVPQRVNLAAVSPGESS